eukprot:gene17691-19459_t
MFLSHFFSAKEATKPDSHDEIGDRITEKGKAIDVLSSLIERSTDGMEDEIEKAGKDIDSPEAQKRIEIAGDNIDELSDEMDKKIEEKGREIEESAKVESDGSDDDDDDEKVTSPVSNGEKHASLRRKPMAKTFIKNDGGYQKEAELQRRLEEEVELKGKRVEDIGNGKLKRNMIQYVNNKIRNMNKKTQIDKLTSDRKIESKKRRNNLKSHGPIFRGMEKKSKKRKLINKNATKRRVIVPVKRKKLEKLMLFYYVTEKMKTGELPVHNLEKFFKTLDGYSKDSSEEDTKKKLESAPDLASLVKTVSEGAKRDKGIKSPNGIEEQPSMDRITGFIDKLKANIHDTETKGDDDGGKDDAKYVKPDLDSFIQTLGKKLRTSKDNNEETTHSSGSDESGGVTKSLGTEAMGVSGDENENAADVKNLEEPKTHADKSASLEAEITRKQVQKMLSNIAEINATLLRNGKKHKTFHSKPKPKKRCKEGNCVGREIISMLDKALHEVQKEKDEPSKPKSVNAPSNAQPKIAGDVRSKSDPYAGIGFMTNQDGTKNTDASDASSDQQAHSVQGESRKLEPHSSDIIGTTPMHHYPNRHVHDHLDVDSMLRGHPYPHHHHMPEVSLEGPISLAPVYEDMHHMLNGPGIHDQTDVHYEVEMHAHPVQHGVDRVTELSNDEVEAPDYDHEGHMQPNIHREDIDDDDNDE